MRETERPPAETHVTGFGEPPGNDFGHRFGDLCAGAMTSVTGSLLEKEHAAPEVGPYLGVDQDGVV